MKLLVVFGAGIIALLVNLALIPIILRISHKKGWYDSIDHRKIHTGEVPRLGGIGLFWSFFCSVVLVLSLSTMFLPGFHLVFTTPLIFMFLGFALMHTIGLIDDFKNIPAGLKLVGQILAAVFISAGGANLTGFEFPFVHYYVNFGVASGVLTVFWLISLANAVNLIDGLDGLAGGTSVIGALFIGIIHLIFENTAGALISFALVGALIAFLVFNFPKAKIFMGDSGSLVLGFSLGSLAFIQLPPELAAGAVGISITLLFVPIIDMVSAMIRRIRRRVPIHTPDREHLHHKLLDFGLSAKQILAIIYPLTAVAGLGAVTWAVSRKSPEVSYLVGDVAMVFVWFVILVFFLTLHRKNDLRKQNKRRTSIKTATPVPLELGR
jgi:UDP-GlcNAc:undecaprenyl-phosphate GlcNAc-1-phosphate transferase